MARRFGERDAAEEAKKMTIIADYLLQMIRNAENTQQIPWDSRAIAQMSCEIYRKLSNP